MGVTKSEQAIIRKNSTGSEMRKRRMNFIEGANVTLTISEDSTNNEIDITIAASSGAAGSLPIYVVAASDASSKWTDVADYTCDGTADEVQIQAAIDAVKTTGGTVWLSEGTFVCAAAIVIDGAGGADTVNVTLKGQGNESTFLDMANNIDGIQLTDDPKVHLSDFQIQVLGTGHGIKSTAEATTYRGFWNSSFKNIMVRGDFSTHSGWALYLEGPFRSVFENIEGLGIGNGIYLAATNSAFNPGNLLFKRCFMDLSQANGTAYKLWTPNGGGQFNICTFIQCEAIDSEATSTTSIGWHLRGSATTYHATKNIFVLSSNIEQFNTAVKFEHAIQNTFQLNYVDVKDGGTMILADSDSKGNDVTILSGFVPDGDTQTLINDANTDATMPNTVRRYEGFVGTGSTLNATVTSATQFDRVSPTTSAGTIDTTDIPVGKTKFAEDIIVPDEAYGAGWNGSFEVPTKNAIYDKIEALGVLSDGDKGDITVSSSGTVWTVDNDAITYAKIQNVSATDKILGRVSASAGDIEEITFTDQAQQLADDTSFSAMRTTLGLAIGTDVQAQDAFLQDIADLTDPGADRILFWDDSAGELGWLTAGSGLSISGTSITASGGSSKPEWHLNIYNAINGTATASGNHRTMDVANATYLYIESSLPSTYAGGGLTLDVYFAIGTDTDGGHSASITAGIMRHAADTDDLDADSYASDQSSSTFAPLTSTGLIRKRTITFTDGAQMDSLAAGESFTLRLRHSGSISGNVKFIGARFRET